MDHHEEMIHYNHHKRILNKYLAQMYMNYLFDNNQKKTISKRNKNTTYKQGATRRNALNLHY